jgi:hypothetical protein
LSPNKTLQKYQVYTYVDSLPYFLPGKELYIPTFLKKTADVVMKALYGIGLATGIKIRELETQTYTDDEVIWLWVNNELSFELRLIAEVYFENPENHTSSNK